MIGSATEASKRAMFAALVALAAACAQTGQPPSSVGAGDSPPAPRAVKDEDPAPREGVRYRDPQGRFEVEAPSGTVRLSERGSLPERNPPLDGRVRFQLLQLVGTDVADLEPPPLAIEVFAAAPASLATWLGEHHWTSARSKLEPTTVSGASEAIWVRDPSQLSPNETLWVAAGEFIYRLVPVGEGGLAAVESFVLR